MRRAFLTLAAFLAVSAPQLHAANYVYLLTGQSNSLGAVKGSPATPGQLERYASGGMLWNGNMVRDTGECFEKNPAWVRVEPQLPRYTALCMGPEYGFAHMMQRRGWHAGNGDKVYIIKASLDGGGNSYWLPDGAAWKSLTGTLHRAMGALKGRTSMPCLLYLQGESDKGEEIAKAAVRFADLHKRLRKEAAKHHTASLRFAVVGECATWSGRETTDDRGRTSAGQMRQMAAADSSVGWVRTRDLSKISSGDNMGVHYDGKSQLTIGARYAYAVARLEKLPVCCARSDDAAALLSTPGAWWSGKAPGAGDVLVWDMAAANAEDKLGRDMSVAGVRVEDPFAGGVVVAAGARQETLRVGARGIELEEGDLTLHCALEVAGGQTWRLAAGRKLAVGSPSKPVELKGRARIVLAGAPDAVVELHCANVSQVEWAPGTGGPVLRATIAGKPATLTPAGAVYKLAPAP